MSKEIIDLARKLGEELAQSSEYLRYFSAKEALKNNQDLKNKINEFKVQKMIVDMENKKEESKREESLLDALGVRIDELYREINEHPVMKEFNESESAMNTLLNAVNITIGSYIKDEDTATAQSSCSPEKCSSCSAGCAHKH